MSRGCDDEAASRRLLIIVNIVVTGEERDTSPTVTCFCRHIHNKVQSTVVEVGIRLNDSRHSEF